MKKSTIPDSISKWQRKSVSKIKYTIFRTKWGYFGLVCAENCLFRTVLPCKTHEKTGFFLLKDLPNAKYEKILLKDLQQQITAYFDGSYINFSEKNVPLTLDGFTKFQASILTACRDIKFGQIITYGDLALRAGRQNAARAVGSVMAKNPIPLIIPCHRIIRFDGSLGGFSSPGGIMLKKRLLTLEKQTS